MRFAFRVGAQRQYDAEPAGSAGDPGAVAERGA